VNKTRRNKARKRRAFRRFLAQRSHYDKLDGPTPTQRLIMYGVRVLKESAIYPRLIIDGKEVKPNTENLGPHDQGNQFGDMRPDDHEPRRRRKWVKRST